MIDLDGRDRNQKAVSLLGKSMQRLPHCFCMRLMFWGVIPYITVAERAYTSQS